MESVERCPLERRRGSSKGHSHLRQSGRRSARSLPPLSWTLRDSPEPQAAVRAYSFGEREIARCFPERPSARGPFA